MKGKHIKLPDVNFTPAFITADDVISESAKSLADMLAEAQAKALKEGIKANTVIIDEHFAKVNAFDFVFGRDVMHLPPMICGLEVQISDELPDGYDFAVLEAPETERERLIRRARAEAFEDFATRAKEKMQNLARMEYGSDEIYFLIGESFIDNLVKELTEGEK